jgi:hypothetical protein
MLNTGGRHTAESTFARTAKVGKRPAKKPEQKRE